MSKRSGTVPVFCSMCGAEAMASYVYSEGEQIVSVPEGWDTHYDDLICKECAIQLMYDEDDMYLIEEGFDG